MSTRPIANAFTALIKNDPRQDQYYRFESESESGIIVQSLSLVERLHPEEVLMVCNRSHPSLHYVGANCQNVFGFSSEEFKRMTVSDFFGRIHPDDMHGLQQCFEFINDAEPYNPITHRFYSISI